jgi:hypothetical protein
MSGDFGEIVAYLYLAGSEGGGVVGPKRWRLKEDRTKSAPCSDVVQLVFSNWPNAGDAGRRCGPDEIIPNLQREIGSCFV